MRLRPLYDHILVERVEEERQTPGGVLIPDTAQGRPQQGKVIATGEGRLMEDGKVRPLLVATGDVVFFTRSAGSEFQFDGEQHLIIREADVLAILR